MDNPERYYRAAIAIPIERKAMLMERLAALNMETIGDLVTTFIMTPGIVEAMQPLATKFMTGRREKKTAASERQKMIKLMKGMDSAGVQRLVELSGSKEVV